MKGKLNHFYLNKLGFTLVELLVVMAILGILATVGLASFRSSQIKGRDAQRKHDLGQLQRALEAYYNDKGQYPIDTLPSGQWSDEHGTLYIKEVPTDPTGYKYVYESEDGTYYKIFAHLENLKDKDIQDCSVVADEPCGMMVSCNYGVASANVDLCEEIP